MAEPWIEPTDKADTYQIGDPVTHADATWESLVKDNWAEPGTDEAAWVSLGPTLRARAIEAFEQATGATERASRDALAGVIDTGTAETLKLVEHRDGDDWRLLVFTDDDVHLAARAGRENGDDWEVLLVAPDPNGSGWVFRSGPVRDLAELGAAITAVEG